MYLGHGMTSRLPQDLAQISAYLFDTTAEMNAFASTFVPPTPRQVFDTWGRFSNYTDWFPGGTTPTGESTAWAYNDTLERIECTLNTVTTVGFVSPDTLDSYTLEATLSSSNTDDDYIGLVAAFKNEGGQNNALIVWRTNRGVLPALTWGLYVIYNGAVQTLVNASNAATVGFLNPGQQGWYQSGPTRVKVIRNKNIITAVCSPFGSTVYDESTSFVFDLTSNAKTQPLVGPQGYGFAANSQVGATFTDVDLIGALAPDKIYDKQTGKVYQYNASTSAWVEQATTIKASIGYPRKVLNPYTGYLYYINYNGIITKL